MSAAPELGVHRMHRWLLAGLVAATAIIVSPSQAADAATSSPGVFAGIPATSSVSDPVGEEPPGRPDDPPLDSGPPEQPSTVLEDFRAPSLPDVPDTFSTRSLSQNRTVGSVIAAGGEVVVHEATLAAIGSVADRSTARAGGADRYETAIALSAGQYPSGAADVWLATGQNFPDGLTASSIAGARGGPVLLTSRDEVPASVLAELARLAPRNVWVVGGPSAISEDVVQSVANALPGTSIARRDGADRYETAAFLAEGFFDSATAVFVATGQNFPDALSAGPAAAGQQAPTLLVTSASIPPATEAQLRRLRPSVVYVVGGPDVVSDGVATQISSLTGGRVERVAGDDRYATAAAVADRFFEATTPSLVLATGVNFPDSVAAGAVAGALSSPLLLVDGNDIPPRVTVDAARHLSWWLPDSGRVIRYTVIAHPDDEFAAWSIIGERDSRRYDVLIVLTTGESTIHCNGLAVNTPWKDLQYLPLPQPTGLQYSERCKQHRMDSWNVFAEQSGFTPSGATPEHLTGGPLEFAGREIAVPLRRDEDGTTVVTADDFTLSVGADSAVLSFDMGALTSDEVLWAVQTARGLADRFPTQVEGDIIGAGFYNDAGTGYENLHEDHHAVYELLGTTDLGLPGSQYTTVGHAQSARVFGASVTDYCDAMCHPGATAPFRGEMGRFQYSYGWLNDGLWQPAVVDTHAGFSEYQSFAKWF